MTLRGWRPSSANSARRAVAGAPSPSATRAAQKPNSRLAVLRCTQRKDLRLGTDAGRRGMQRLQSPSPSACDASTSSVAGSLSPLQVLVPGPLQTRCLDSSAASSAPPDIVSSGMSQPQPECSMAFPYNHSVQLAPMMRGSPGIYRRTVFGKCTAVHSYAMRNIVCRVMIVVILLPMLHTFRVLSSERVRCSRGSVAAASTAVWSSSRPRSCHIAPDAGHEPHSQRGTPGAASVAARRALHSDQDLGI